MGTIQIFSCEFSTTRLAVSRDLVRGYVLQVGDHTVSMTPEIAGALAFGGQRIRLRAQAAVRSGSDMKPGPAVRRNMITVDGRAVHVELGVSDGGTDVYLEIAGSRMSLTEEQAQLLLFSLDRLRDDVAAVRAGGEGEPYQLAVGWDPS